jgi:hypothetical protein
MVKSPTLISIVIILTGLCIIVMDVDFMSSLSNDHRGFYLVLCGFVQVTTLPECPEVYNTVNKLRVESVVAVEGVVRPRPADAINADMKTGAIEVLVVT